MSIRLRGVVAAIATPVTRERAPDIPRFLALARHLLANGCDGLNVLGTTGEATSFSREQRADVVRAAAAGLDRARMMVGTGAAALDDAATLTRLAGELGFAGALVLPPFYYKGVGEDGVFDYIATLVAASADAPAPIYLYNYPALSGVPYAPDLVARLIAAFPSRIAGLKDSSGDLAYERLLAERHPGFDVFPANEATLLEGRGGRFAGCVSATANLNADLCARAWRDGDAAALEKAMRIRRLFDGKPLVAGVKAGLAALHADPALAAPMPPLTAWSAEDAASLARDLSAARADG
jgi:4-hydroxy-tetrahydrodipicolinate synthase